MKPPAETTPLEAVRQHLTQVAGLTELTPTADALVAALRPSASGFRLAPSAASPLQLQVEGHFTLETHGLILDRRLGSIGIIHHLPDLAPDPAITDEKARLQDREIRTKNRINQLIENAAYLRHLLALQRSAAPDPTQTLLPAIEVVFLADAIPATNASRSALAENLRTSLQQSALLHALSVNLALISTGSPANLDASLRRAFCWLLPATRAWLAARPPASTDAVAWHHLRLENFRRPGTRRWTKDASARLHVIHGPNGSGKTSLAEGFEYAVTGDSMRLKKTPGSPATDPARHAPLIYRGPGAAGVAKATLLTAKDATSPLFAHASPPSAAAASPKRLTIPGGSFRLDQKLVDQLSLSEPDTRMRIWLETFFPEQDRLHGKRREHRTALRKAIADLVTSPDKTATERLLDAAVDQAQRLAGGATATLADFLLPLLAPDAGLDPARLGELGLQLPALLSFEFSVSDTGESAWTQTRGDELTTQAARLLPQDAAVLADWRGTDHAALLQFLEELGRRGFGGQESPTGQGYGIDEGGDQRTTFNHHLRVVALLDLLDRARVIARTTESLPTHAADPLLAGIKPNLSADEIDKEILTLRDKRESLRSRLSALDEQARVERGDPDPAGLTEGQLAILRAAVEANVFSPDLPAEHSSEFLDAIRHRRETRVRELVVGPPGWTEPLVAILRQRETALSAFAATLLRSQTHAKTHAAKSLAPLVDAIVKIARLERDSARQFLDFSRDAHLAPAIDELLALFTPARWAYSPLDVRITADTGRDQRDDRFELQSQGLDVGQVLNTAELNTLALSIYLLCAPWVDNPCRALFLDDPFQNMDELTVATVTRGLARLLRLWGLDDSVKLADWDVVVLLHGEETCQRVLLETRAAFYRLPWLAPTDAPTAPADADDDDVTSAPGTEKGELLSLAGFFAEPPA